MKPRRPKPWPETNRQERTRYVWRFEDRRYWTAFFDDAEEARADATTQITEQIKGSWQERSGRRMLVEDWIDLWVSMLGDIEPTTRAKYKYFVEGHILPEFQGRQLGALTFEEIEAWDNAIPKRISARDRPYARSVATSARSLLITILGDAVHAGKIERNPAERRKGRRGRMRAKGRTPSRTAQESTANVITPFQALCLAERCALLSGQDIDFIMNVFAAWTGVRWGELTAVEGWPGKNSPLQTPETGISTYAVDWQLRELGGVVRKSAPKDGSFRVLDLPPFPRRPHALGHGEPARHMHMPARRRSPILQGRGPDASCILVPRPERWSSTPVQLRRRFPDSCRRRTASCPERRTPARLCHRRALARHPHPPRQPQEQGSRPRGWHMAELGRQVQAAR
jgi:hypothetical protein